MKEGFALIEESVGIMHSVPGIPVKLLLAIGFGMFLGVLSANSIPIIIGVLIVTH